MNQLILKYDKQACNNKVHVQNVFLGGISTGYSLRTRKTKTTQAGWTEVLKDGRTVWKEKSIGMKPAMKYLAKTIL